MSKFVEESCKKVEETLIEFMKVNELTRDEAEECMSVSVTPLYSGEYRILVTFDPPHRIPRCFKCKKKVPDWITCDDCLRKQYGGPK